MNTTCFLNALPKTAYWLFFIFMASGFTVLRGQSHFPESNSILTYTSNEEYKDMEIPSNTTHQYIFLEANGGDGGTAGYNHNGGSGATASALFEIGTNAGQIKPGSVLRLIPGKAGRNHTDSGGGGSGGGGGGGSAILVKAPETSDWNNSTILMVAGGGGGGGRHGAGLAANTDQFGTAGRNKDGESLKNGGSFLKPGGPTDNASGGASADMNASPVNGDFTPLTPAYKGFPSGGKGAYCGENHGGWGFGGGGAGDFGGGGGGGISGGGGGGDSGDLTKGGGGGGGGSYINKSFNVTQERITVAGSTDTPHNGYVKYRLVTPKSIQLATRTEKCIDESLFPDINLRLFDCNNTLAQGWIFEGSQIIATSKFPSKCMDLKENKQIGSTNIQLYDCNGTNAQKWIYDGLSKKIRLAENWAYCLDLYQGSDNSGTNVQLGICDGIDGGGVTPGVPPAQQWVIDGASTPDMSTKVKTIRPAGYTDKCIENANGGLSDGTNIQWGICQSGIKYQQWKLDGETIKPAGHPNKCVDLTSSNTADGTNIQLYECNGSDAQKWIYDGMTQAFRSGVNPDKCLNHLLPSPIQNITLSDCNGSVFQQFVIE